MQLVTGCHNIEGRSPTCSEYKDDFCLRSINLVAGLAFQRLLRLLDEEDHSWLFSPPIMILMPRNHDRCLELWRPSMMCASCRGRLFPCWLCSIVVLIREVEQQVLVARPGRFVDAAASVQTQTPKLAPHRRTDKRSARDCPMSHDRARESPVMSVPRPISITRLLCICTAIDFPTACAPHCRRRLSLILPTACAPYRTTF